MSNQKPKCLLSVCQHHLNSSEMYLSQCSAQAAHCASLRRYLCVCRPKAETQIWKTDSPDMKSLTIFLRYWIEVTNMTEAEGWGGRPDPRCPPRSRSTAESLLQLTGKAQPHRRLLNHVVVTARTGGIVYFSHTSLQQIYLKSLGLCFPLKTAQISKRSSAAGHLLTKETLKRAPSPF